jgi:hypothetical protein
MVLGVVFIGINAGFIRQLVSLVFGETAGRSHGKETSAAEKKGGVDVMRGESEGRDSLCSRGMLTCIAFQCVSSAMTCEKGEATAHYVLGRRESVSMTNSKFQLQFSVSLLMVSS